MYPILQIKFNQNLLRIYYVLGMVLDAMGLTT